MTKNKEGNNKLWWDNLSSRKKITIVIVILMVIPLVINGLLWLSNCLFSLLNLNISARGLGNIDWLNFWGNYISGITTVLAVWLTIRQTERHYKQTSDEQKRQNDTLKMEQERQRKLDVLPLILLQPRQTKGPNPLEAFIGASIRTEENQQISLNEINTSVEEFDLAEITVLFAPDFQIRPGGLLQEELRMVESSGNIIERNGNMASLSPSNITIFRPFWLINVGKETAINLEIILKSSDDHEITRLHDALSLLPRDKVKVNFLVNVAERERERILTDYKWLIRYNDIYTNSYEQIFPIALEENGNGMIFYIELDVKHSGETN